jgi:hypothetical protein
MNSVFDTTYREEDAGGVLQYRAVVQGANEGGCKKPAAANAGGFLGFTQASAAQNIGVPVRKLGTSRAVAAGVIAAGDYVNIADNVGKVQSCQADVDAAPGVAKQLNVIGKAETAAGADGDVIQVFVCPFVVKTAAS